MAKKIKLSELKLKSSVTELNQKERKDTKGGYFSLFSVKKGAAMGHFSFPIIDKDSKIADTQVDIRFDEGGLSNQLTGGN